MPETLTSVDKVVDAPPAACDKPGEVLAAKAAPAGTGSCRGFGIKVEASGAWM